MCWTAPLVWSGLPRPMLRHRPCALEGSKMCASPRERALLAQSQVMCWVCDLRTLCLEDTLCMHWTDCHRGGGEACEELADCVQERFCFRRSYKIPTKRKGNARMKVAMRMPVRFLSRQARDHG